MSQVKYKRVLLKISGEALAGEGKFGIDQDTVGKITDKIKQLVAMNVQVGIVVGGGNFWARRAAAAIWTGPAPTIWVWLRRSSTPSRCRTPWNSGALPRGCRRPSRCAPSRSLISGAGRCGIWKRAGS
jgi:hypothetical protein